jgi:hypothetical protein
MHYVWYRMGTCVRIPGGKLRSTVLLVAHTRAFLNIRV